MKNKFKNKKIVQLKVKLLIIKFNFKKIKFVIK